MTHKQCLVCGSEIVGDTKGAYRTWKCGMKYGPKEPYQSTVEMLKPCGNAHRKAIEQGKHIKRLQTAIYDQEKEKHEKDEQIERLEAEAGSVEIAVDYQREKIVRQRKRLHVTQEQLDKFMGIVAEQTLKIERLKAEWTKDKNAAKYWHRKAGRQDLDIVRLKQEVDETRQRAELPPKYHLTDRTESKEATARCVCPDCGQPHPYRAVGEEADDGMDAPDGSTMRNAEPDPNILQVDSKVATEGEEERCYEHPIKHEIKGVCSGEIYASKKQCQRCREERE